MNLASMNISQRLESAILITLFTIFSAALAMADPPGRAVDIRYISGQVSVQPGGVNDWVEAVVNRPLTTADRVWTDKDSRAELHLGSSALRMNSETSMTLTNVDDQTVQVELDQGTLNLWVRHLYDGEIYEVDTPNLAFTVTKAGDYRFDVDPDGDTTMVAVRHGEGEATGQGNAVTVHAGEMGTFNNGTSLQHQAADLAAPDGFDDWCNVRDEREDRSLSARYVSPDVVGADDLDQYGTWRVEPGYGAVWIPAGVEVGWAPYHYGHWVWVEPWGWTWVDDAPWGYAPSHYGRWVFYGGAWGWSPGPVVVGIRPVYAPALVAWVGGAHWGLGIGVGFGGGIGVGWFPLGYGEPYRPTYAVSRTYFQNVNVSNTHITNITTVTNNYYVNNSTTVNTANIHYANQTVPGAMTAVPASAMTNSQSVAKAAVQIPPSEAAKAPMAATPGVIPAKTSVLGANAGAHAAAPPAQVTSRPVVTKSAPPPKPIPFEAKQEALAKNGGRPLDPQTEQQIRRQMPAQTAQTPKTGTTPAPNAAGAKNASGGNPTNGRVVPRPPSAGGSSPRPAGNASSPIGNNQGAGTNTTRSVPRPPSAAGTSANSSASRTTSSPSTNSESPSQSISRSSGTTTGTTAREPVPRPSTPPKAPAKKEEPKPKEKDKGK